MLSVLQSKLNRCWSFSRLVTIVRITLMYYLNLEKFLYKSEKDLQLLINHEKDFFTGTPQEQDSIKDLIRYWEHKGGYDKPSSTLPPPKTNPHATESHHPLGGFLRLTASYF